MSRARLQLGIAVAVLAATAGATRSGGEAQGARESARAPDALVMRHAARAPAGHGGTARGRVAASTSWWGGIYFASTGDAVNLTFADVYPHDPAFAASWAQLFATLVHGNELGLLRVYVAPLEWIREICGEGTLGCYGGNEMVTYGGGLDGVTPWDVAAHEYGHHVAANRSNSPWTAVDWGTKRWASYVKVCSRAAAGTAFPGDEGIHYRLNPGEAFAEAYRVLNERRRGGAPFGWSLVDGSFIPDDHALALVEQDVREPWNQGRLRVVNVPRKAKSWRLPLNASLDGSLDVTLTMGSPSYQLSLVDGTKTIARGLWSGARSQRLTYTVCGERALALRVVRRGAASRAAVAILSP